MILDAAELRALLGRLRLSQTEAAHLVGVDPRAMRRWCSPDNDKPMPPVAERLLFLMEATPAVVDMVRVIAENVPPARLKTVHDEEDAPDHRTVLEGIYDRLQRRREQERARVTVPP